MYLYSKYNVFEKIYPIYKYLNRAILRYSFCRGRDILNIHLFITLSILMLETSYCTYMEAVTCVSMCDHNFLVNYFNWLIYS